MKKLSEVATSLIEYSSADKRVCPIANKWQALWKMLPEDLTKEGRDRTAPLPLILAAIECAPWEKRMRVKDHIEWADAHNVIRQVDLFLRTLSSEEWEQQTSNYIKDNFYNECSFKYCIDNDDVEGMKIYLSNGVNPNDSYSDYSKGNALVRAAEEGAINAIAYLLSIGVELDAASLGAAAVRAHNDILKLLLDAGVIPDADALCSAAGTNNVQGVKRLLLANVSINNMASFGWYALHNAVIEEQTEIVELLLKSGANPDVATKDGTTPLMFAMSGGDIAIVDFLLKYGANPLCKNENGETALDKAIENNQQTVINILESFINQ